MKIERAIDITKDVSGYNQPDDVDSDVINSVIKNLSLKQIEKKISDHGLHPRCFGVFRVVYSDDVNAIYFDYPTDMLEEEATEFITKVFSQT